MEKKDITNIVDSVVEDIITNGITEESKTDLTEEGITFDIELIEEGLIEESAKETIGKVANDSIKIVRDKIKKDYNEYSPALQTVAAKMAPEIMTAIIKKDHKLLTKVADVSTIAAKHYLAQFLSDVTSEIITTGATTISKDISKKFDKMKEKYKVDEAEEAEYELLD